MKKTFCILAVVLLFGARAFAQEKPTVAVATFDTIGGVTKDEAQIVTELFMTELVSKGTVNVVDRVNFDKIIAEMKFQTSDWSNSQKTARLGAALNAQYVIRGQLMKMDTVLYWTATMIDVNTAQVLYSAREQMAGLGEVYGKLPTYCKQILDKVPMPNYFVGKWKSASEGCEMEIEFKADGSLQVAKYQIKDRDKAYSFTGSGNYAYASDTLTITLNLNGSFNYTYRSISYTPYLRDQLRDETRSWGPNISYSESFTFTQPKDQFSFSAFVSRIYDNRTYSNVYDSSNLDLVRTLETCYTNFVKVAAQ